MVDELVQELTGIVGRREATWIYEHVAAQGPAGITERARGLARRRAQGEPLQYVLGTWPFRDLELEVGPEALIPRPETEAVVEVALGRWREQRPGQGDVVIVDLGTGSGAMGLSVAHKLARESSVRLWLTDRSRAALRLARRNAERLGIEASCREGSWFDALDPELSGHVHLLVSNPPYVPIEQRGCLDPVLAHEPPEALYTSSGTQGTPGFLEVESVLRGALGWLAPRGVIVVEMGEGQVEVAVELAREVGFVDVRGFSDLAAKPRGILASAPVKTFGADDLAEVAMLLDVGHVVAVPTDTVYGLGARPDDVRGVEAIFRMKGRPASLALPILAASLDDALSLVGTLPPVAEQLARAFWPGPVTLVVEAPEDLARHVRSASATVGLRVPDLELTRLLLARSGPLAVTSANRHGDAPCTSAEEVKRCFARPPQPSGVLDGGVSTSVASTVVAVRGATLEILRHGALSEGELRAALS